MQDSSIKQADDRSKDHATSKVATMTPSRATIDATSGTLPKCRRLLIVDDDPADVFLVRQTLLAINASLTIEDVCNGEEALNFLRQHQPYEESQLPHFILLDLNMPRLNGHETLAEIRKDENLKHLPVIILTTSTSRSDIQRAYDLQATCYLSKQLEMDEFAKQLESVATFWGRTVCYPE